MKTNKKIEELSEYWGKNLDTMVRQIYQGRCPEADRPRHYRDFLKSFADVIRSDTIDECIAVLPKERKKDDLGAIEGNDTAELYYDQATGFNDALSQSKSSIEKLK